MSLCLSVDEVVVCAMIEISRRRLIANGAAWFPCRPTYVGISYNMTYLLLLLHHQHRRSTPIEMMFDNLTIKTHTVCAHVALMISIFHEPNAFYVRQSVFCLLFFSPISFSFAYIYSPQNEFSHTRVVVKFTCRRTFRPRGRRFNARRVRIERWRC